jgi:hypothetical protein
MSQSGCGHTHEEHVAMKEDGVWETLILRGYLDTCVEDTLIELRDIPVTRCTLGKVVCVDKAVRAGLLSAIPR